MVRGLRNEAAQVHEKQNAISANLASKQTALLSKANEQK